MNIKSIIALSLLAGLLVLGTTAFAHGPGFGQGPGWGSMGPGMMGYGSGHMWNYGNGYHRNFEESNSIWNELNQKQAELNAALNAPEINESKVKALQAEINRLQNKLDQSHGHAGFGPGYHWR